MVVVRVMKVSSYSCFCFNVEFNLLNRNRNNRLGIGLRVFSLVIVLESRMGWVELVTSFPVSVWWWWVGWGWIAVSNWFY